ncbi:MAG: acyl-CoA dehydrogenase [Myxococcales bacterium]|nr:acyl-CoA/acyl-ACP dehydrogenase [Deltaproteobacteria bacterium]MBT8481402.1 acyl-CoA/acyl-ACP dehydrogenase [Deltaproteobacteria bacterium]NND29319.1 acyl-CoA dehydrogenase [Myxococcales bacterium]NNL24265.1 acyl-CoA dehydrogenase [Myxococcales bacterium]RZV55445.1 MAG: acyl-CoA dehydrogenase [Deltaproteobacteria bacterium]
MTRAVTRETSEDRAPSLLLNEEQKMLSKTAHDFIRSRGPAARIRSFRDSGDEVGFSRELWGEMAELGWLGLQIPERYQGMGLGFFDLAVVLEESGRELMPEPFVSTLLLGAQALLLGGSEQQKRALLPGVAAGDTLVSVGYEEAGRQGGASLPAMLANESGDGFELSGEKLHVLDGHMADRIIVSAATSSHGCTLFLIDPAQPSVTVTRQSRIDGLSSAIVRLEGVPVKRDAMVGELDAGAALLEAVFDRASVGLAAQMLGASEQAFADTIDYIKEREQFGVPIGSFQALQHRAVSVYTDIALTRSVVLAAARAVDESPVEVPRLASLAQAMASDTFMHAAKEAIQMHGGIGVTDAHDIGFYMKRAQASYMMFGTPAQHRKRWAELHGY